MHQNGRTYRLSLLGGRGSLLGLGSLLSSGGLSGGSGLYRGLLLGGLLTPMSINTGQRQFDCTHGSRGLSSGLSGRSGLGGNSLDRLGLLNGSNGSSGLRHYEDLGGREL